MLLKNLNNKITISLVIFAAAFVAPGCSLINEELEPCPKEMRLKFEYGYLKDTNAFGGEVGSINVWAFDKQGRLAWSGETSAQELTSEDSYMETPLDEGEYDIVAWCGLKDNDDFELLNYTPTSKADLEVRMKTIEEEGKHISRVNLHGLYNGTLDNVKYEPDPQKPSIMTCTVPLIKDTKDIRIMLQHLDGREIANRDFSATITDSNAQYAWDNALIGSEMVTYQPWNVKYGVVTAPGAENQGSRDITTVASLMFELSTGRLMTESNAILTVRRNVDNRDIIRIPLIDYLLLIRGNYGNISNQEYLDMQDDYSIVFFIDENSNWYVAGGIYINGWAVVPPQDYPL